MSVRDQERLLGVDVDVITRSELIERVSTAVRAGTKLWVGNHNLHSAYLVRDDAAMRRWYDVADLVFVDGMSLVAVSRARRGRLRRAHRATVIDWMPQVLDAAAGDGKVVFHLGGDPAWIEQGATTWRAQHPGLEVHVHHGYFDHARSDDVVARINDVQPDLLLIGMGSPIQERWAAEHAAALDVPVVVIVGAFLGFAGGVVAHCPRWIGDIGMEWAWRLATNPRHVARRYLVEPFLLVRSLRQERARS